LFKRLQVEKISTKSINQKLIMKKHFNSK